MFEKLFGKKSILVVEDEQETANLLIEFLTLKGIKARHAKNGIEGLEMSRSMHPDLIILDVMMPGMAGFDVLLNLKADPKLSKIPVMMCTALNDIKDVERCCNFGAEGYITKPFELKRVYERILAILDKSSESA